MNKTELVKAIAEKCKLTQDNTSKFVDALFATITDSLKEKQEVSIPGFGKFKVSERAARKARNPRTGAEIQIAASTAPVFSAGKALKEAVSR